MLEIMTDEEALREQGMADGKTKKGKFVLRPMTPVSLSWCQRNLIFSDDVGDSMHKTAAYVFLHSEPKEIIRAVVHNRQDFANAVDDWMDEHLKHHNELETYSDHMSESMNVYLASISRAVNPSTDSQESKN